MQSIDTAFEGSAFAAVDSIVGGTTGPPALDPVPARFAVVAAGPNPSASGSAIRLDLPEAADVRVQVFDVKGRLIRTL